MGIPAVEDGCTRRVAEHRWPRVVARGHRHVVVTCKNVRDRARWKIAAVLVAAAIAVAVSIGGCQQAAKDPVTLTFLDPEWSHDSRDRDAAHEQVLTDFTRETGIRVTHLPAPENSPAQLALARDLLKRGAVTPDVYGIDVVWPGILSDYLIDLSPPFAAEAKAADSELIANYTVRGKLVAMPYHSNVGVLFYRTDLLEEYGFKEPPRTWDELENMALRIQEGERAKGQKDFWGYAWPGAASEGLMCNALEWQVSEGGGRIVENDGRISVNNPKTIAAWKRTAHWLGRISPPTSLSYQEWDSSNAFATSGKVAFQRGWMSDYFIGNPVAYPVETQMGITSVPGGDAGRVGTFGGLGLAVSKSSQHQAEAITLVRFLLRKEAELEHQRATSQPPAFPVRFEIPTLLTAYAHLQATGGKPGAHDVARPSTVTAEKYDEVSRAYVEALHSVLEGKVKAETAAAALETQLEQITGFSAVKR
jgi:trehalose/maltose transport system substrate-binding protein